MRNAHATVRLLRAIWLLTRGVDCLPLACHAFAVSVQTVGAGMARRMILTLAIFTLAIILWSNAGFAEGALAIGLPDNSPNNGFVVGISHDKPTSAEARDKAMADCRGSNIERTTRAKAACRIVETFDNQCANDAINGSQSTASTAVGWAVGPDTATTNRRAVTMCETMRRGKGPPCRADGDPICDGTAK